LSSNLTKIKRKRGGQKNNQNARKHGFYSSALNHDEICRFWNIVNQESIDSEMAVLRIKLQSLIQRAPSNRRTLKEVSRLIVKWSVKKYRLGRAARACLKAAVMTVLECSSGISLNSPEWSLKKQIVSEKTNYTGASIALNEKTEKRIERNLTVYSIGSIRFTHQIDD